jgi:hypothetical protein
VIPAAPHLYPPNNTLRLITGTGIGLALSTMIYPAFNQVAWEDSLNEPILKSWAEFTLLIGLAGVLIAIILDGNPLALYPLALLSAAGVLILLTVAYALITIPFLRKMSSAGTLRQLLPALTLAAGMALLQVGAVDLLRWLMTGTWEGFHL